MKFQMITHVACIIDGAIYSLPKPNRHHNVIHSIERLNCVTQSEGFLDHLGRYLTRSEAMKVAIECGQFNRICSDSCYNGEELYSEDLW